MCVRWRNLYREREKEKGRVCIQKNSIRSVFSLQGLSLNILLDSSELQRRHAREKKKGLQLLNEVLHFT